MERFVIMRRRRSNNKPAGFIRRDDDNRQAAVFSKASAEYVMKVNACCGLFTYEMIVFGGEAGYPKLEAAPNRYQYPKLEYPTR